MSVIITTQKKFLKLGKIGPNNYTQSGFRADYKHRDKYSAPRSSPYTVCLPAVGSETDYYDNLIIS